MKTQVKQQRRRQRIQAQVAGRRSRREARRARQDQSFAEPYTPRRARTVARSLVDTEYRPVERQIASEIRGSAKREKDLGQWYGALSADMAAGQQAAQTAFDTAERVTDERLGEATATQQKTAEGLAAVNAKFANAVGAPSTGSAAPVQAEQAAAAERLRAALRAPVTQVRANGVAAFGARRTAVGLQGIEARQEEATRRRTKQSDLQSLRREHGQATVKQLHTLREQEQDRATQKEALGAKEGYNDALNRQSRLGYKGTQLTAAATIAAANAAARARERGASAQEVVAAEQRAAARVTAKGQENTAKIQGKNAGQKASGYSVKEAKSMLRTMFGKKTVSAQKAIDGLVNRGVDYGVAVKAVRQLAGGR